MLSLYRLPLNLWCSSFFFPGHCWRTLWQLLVISPRLWSGTHGADLSWISWCFVLLVSSFLQILIVLFSTLVIYISCKKMYIYIYIYVYMLGRWWLVKAFLKSSSFHWLLQVIGRTRAAGAHPQVARCTHWKSVWGRCPAKLCYESATTRNLKPHWHFDDRNRGYWGYGQDSRSWHMSKRSTNSTDQGKGLFNLVAFWWVDSPQDVE